MGRSVSTPSGAEVVVYSTFECEDADDAQWLWDDEVYNWKYEVKAAFPSLDFCDEWVGWGRSEDHAVLENKIAYIGVSEYCGLVALWVLPKEDVNGNLALGINWANKIKEKFEACCDGWFGTSLVQIGRFSNGEAIFNAKQGANKGDMGLGYSSKEGWI